MNLSTSASSGLRWIDDSNESQNVGHLVTSPLNFFKAYLGNLTLVASAVEVHVNGDGDNISGYGVTAVSGNVELVGISVEVVGNSVEGGSILKGGGSLAGVVLIVALDISFMVISLVTSIIPLCTFSVNTFA